ncbi:MAG: PAS domain S-box protein [Candidatus Latescibacterota bacterium]|nr:MAG: PAS domain S-box protein [Candidatus Latescibacterota bacterium]
MVVIVTVVILLNGLFGSLFSRQYALNASRKAMRFDSASIVNGIETLMMRQRDTGVLEFIEKTTSEGATYQDISLISHPSGKICMSGEADVGSFLGMGDKTCNRCHDVVDSPSRNFAAQDEITTGRDGSRVLRVTTPILNKPGCRTADCHIHIDDGDVLGILETDYSLASFDALMRGLNATLTAGALVAIGLVIIALVLTFRWFLAKPLRRLLRGLHTIGSGDLSFRFSARRNDEIGLVAHSFDQMATRIETQQNELLKTLESLQGIVENTADIVITVGRQDLIRTFNRGAEQVLEYARSEVLGRPVQMLMADPKERDIAVARLRGHDNVMNWESRFKTKNGNIKNVLLTLSRLRDREGNLLGTLAIGKDITTEKDLQRKLIRSEQEAAIGRAVTAIQHAIKNMLNTLKGGVYIVRLGNKKQPQPNERIVEGCDMIEEGLTQISDLAHHMLRYAREWTIKPEPVDLADMVRRVAVAVSQTGTDRNAAVRTEIDRSLSKVSCDPRLIHMGLMDIASNALDACLMKDYPNDEGPEIVIRTRRDESKGVAAIEIQDNGIGMTPEVQASIFVPFFSTKKKGGTGLGMALTARIIDLHDGKIEVESEPGVGSRFCITLPLEGPAKRQGEG